MRSTPAPNRRCTTAAYVALFLGALALAVSVVVVAHSGDESSSDTTVRPIESFSSDDLRDAVRELRRLRGARLTPQERRAVGTAAEALGAIIEGDAVIAPAPTTVPEGDASPPITTTTTTTTSTTSTTTTTTTTAPPATPVRDFAEAIENQLP